LNGTHPINRPFEIIKKVIGTEIQVLHCYPDFNKPVLFHLYTDASDHQLGAVIMKDKKPRAFYSRKIQLKSGIQPLREEESCNILLGYPIKVFTDHKSNTLNGLKSTDRVLRTCWLLVLEEYGVKFEYLPGKKSVIVDALSRLDIDSLKI
jgi:hypothetical protein